MIITNNLSILNCVQNWIQNNKNANNKELKELKKRIYSKIFEMQQ